MHTALVDMSGGKGGEVWKLLGLGGNDLPVTFVWDDWGKDEMM